MKILNNFKTVLLVCVFFTSGLNAAKIGNLDKPTKKEIQETIDVAVNGILDSISPTTKKTVLKEIKLITFALISGAGIGGCAYAYAYDKLDLDYDTSWASGTFGSCVGLTAAIWFYVLLKAVDKKLINSTSDLEVKLKMLENMSVMLNGSGKN
ncbi:MAG: hypothetical protein WCS92_04920 [Candidatus Babeliales bacterium]|jgi:hypothetical protein